MKKGILKLNQGSKMVYAKRIDNTQTIIVKTLRNLGMTVFITSSVGFGYPDLTCSYKNKTYLVEVKDGNKPPSQQKLTELEKKFHDTWQDKVYIINSVDSAIQFFREVVCSFQSVAKQLSTL